MSLQAYKLRDVEMQVAAASEKLTQPRSRKLWRLDVSSKASARCLSDAWGLAQRLQEAFGMYMDPHDMATPLKPIGICIYIYIYIYTYHIYICIEILYIYRSYICIYYHGAFGLCWANRREGLVGLRSWRCPGFQLPGLSCLQAL